jgi:hypothetical protein
MEIIMLVTWSIWITRNDFIFKVAPPGVYRCRKKFKNELAFLVHQAKKSYHGIVFWVENFRLLFSFGPGASCLLFSVASLKQLFYVVDSCFLSYK